MASPQKTVIAWSLVLLLTSPVTLRAASVEELLFEAAKRGDVLQIRELIGRDAKINSQDRNGMSPLMMATNWNKLDAVNSLLELGADPNVQREGQGALFLAVGRDTEIVKALIRAGADVNMRENRFKQTPLTIAAGHREDTFRELKRRGSYTGPVPNRLETVRLLIKAGANVNNVDEYGSTPLRRAMVVNNIEIAHALLESGADVHGRTVNDNRAMQIGDTILMETIGFFSVFKDISAIELLLNHGANPNDRNETPYDEYEEQRGGRNWRGYSALTFAAKQGWFSVVKLLLERGADPILPRTDGKTAKELAEENKHHETAKLIMTYLREKPSR